MISDHLVTSTIEQQKCWTCGKPATSRCAKCHTTSYCSVKCQKKDWGKHKIICTPPRQNNTADFLVKAVMDDLFPEDLDTLADFGLSNCHLQEQRTYLMSVYAGLIKILGVSSKDLHEWQQANELALHIRKTYEDAGASSGYYNWFLKNQHLVDSRTPKADVSQLVRKYLSAEDKDKDMDQLEPQEKRLSVWLYIVLLMGNIPRIEYDIWFHFGFCTCKSQRIESDLGRIYRTLIDQCTLYEFYTNSKSQTLEALLRLKNIDGIDALKAQGVVFGYPNISVYHLKQYVLGEDVPLQRCIGVDYGFYLCRDNKSKQKLRKIYKQLFEHVNFDILQLHQACISGTIYKYASQFVVADANLMKNPYPLADL
ncbi:unnamed protein product [Adineta steineri]|uniref:MYND-type domain-containing protein n=1 Tax=Adineta steineri TaxID=433720 RepID=A0A819UT08_9BILA|nr:unnamed protein product [Adineta steineri]CAF4097603.1 unnamed protein product [Adineta steineri]